MSFESRASVALMKRLRAISAATLLGSSAAFAVCALAPTEAHASVSIAILFDELVERASAAGVVTPLEQHSVWEDGRIFTYTRVHVDAPLAGTVPEEAWVRTLGGVVGKIGQSVDGEAVLTVGHPSLLFVQPVAAQPGTFEVTARAQGQFALAGRATGASSLEGMRFVRAHGVGVVMPPSPDRIARIQKMRAGVVPLAADVLHDRPVAEATRDIQAAWRRLHATPNGN
jgi:hypothetical protein